MKINVPEILRAIQEQYQLEWYGLHGVTHWARVYENAQLVASGTEANSEVLLLFSLFHDSRRENDSVDPGHGRRGADFAAKFRGRFFELPENEFQLLRYACEKHTDGLVDADLTVQVCWDADRLDLARVPGFTVEPDKLCTLVAKDPSAIAWATDRAQRMSEPELLSRDWGQHGTHRS